MAELNIQLRRDPATGKHDVVINLKSDADALPHEHEQAHRELVEKILGKDNVGKVVVEREAPKQPATPAAGEVPQPTRQPLGNPG